MPPIPTCSCLDDDWNNWKVSTVFFGEACSRNPIAPLNGKAAVWFLFDMCHPFVGHVPRGDFSFRLSGVLVI
jgi:hypothetical protein